MRIKKGDTVSMLTGKDAGKTGKVLRVDPKLNKVSVEGLNMRVKHTKPKRQGEKGQQVHFPGFVSQSNVMIVCPSCGKPSRIGAVNNGDKLVRQCKRCKATF